MAAKSKITFVVPESLQAELREKVVAAKYGMRGKSRWVAEAIESLLALKNYPELVSYGDTLQGFEKVETVVVSADLKKALNEAILEVRKHYPVLEGVQSRIVRTAIVHRLIRS